MNCSIMIKFYGQSGLISFILTCIEGNRGNSISRILKIKINSAYEIQRCKTNNTIVGELNNRNSNSRTVLVGFVACKMNNSSYQGQLKQNLLAYLLWFLVKTITLINNTVVLFIPAATRNSANKIEVVQAWPVCFPDLNNMESFKESQFTEYMKINWIYCLIDGS